MKKAAIHPVMRRIVQAFEKSGKTLEDLGLAMGAEKATARQSAWQFISKTADPHVSMLIRFADAMDLDAGELLDHKRKK